MDLENQAVESGLDAGNAGGDVSADTKPSTVGLSLRDSLAKAAGSIRERTGDDGQARPQSPIKTHTALETGGKTEAGSLPGQAGSQEEAASSILEAPKHWPQKRRDAFGRFVATPDAQKEWLDHTKELEGEFTRKSQEHAEYRKFTDSVRELFAPEQRALLQQTGSNELAAIKWWSEVDQFARRDPAGYAKWFMQRLGLTPQQLFPELGNGTAPNGQASTEAEWQDPEILKLREELASLKEQTARESNGYRNWIQQQHNKQQADQQQMIGRTILQFQESKDDAGNPLYPHFAEVEDRMAWELSNNPDIAAMPLSQEKLKTAYDLAVWANPSTRQAMLDARASVEQQVAQQRQAAEKARAAQTLKPKVASVAGAAQLPPQDLKSIIRNAASRAKG